jgi:hypothetical protein
LFAREILGRLQVNGSDEMRIPGNLEMRDGGEDIGRMSGMNAANMQDSDVIKIFGEEPQGVSVSLGEHQ